MKKLKWLVLVVMCGLSLQGFAAGHEAAAGSEAAVQEEMVQGEIKAVKTDTNSLVIKHGAIEHLNMMPMTMVFKVKDKAMLQQVKQGDAVKFAVERIGGVLTVTRLEPMK